MSLINPGKRGILTVIALMLIVGVPGVIAYADGSDDTYQDPSDLLSYYDSVLIKSGSLYEFGCTCTDSAVIIDDVPVDEETALTSLEAVTKFQLVSSQDMFTSAFDKFVFTSDCEFSYVKLLFTVNSESYTFELVYDEDSSSWSYEFTSAEKLSISSATSVKLELWPSESTVDSEVACSFVGVNYETIFTDDVVELIVMVGGILLLICGTFALSFIDVGTPGKAISSAGRGIRSAGRKINRRSR